jgi:hypothetical protein
MVKWILERQDGVVWTVSIWLRTGTVEGSCEHGNEPSGSINAGKFLSSCIISGFLRRAQIHEVN